MKASEYERMYDQEDTYWWFVGRRRLVLSLMGRQFPQRTDLRILDIGCGTGAMSLAMHHLGNVISADLSQQALEFTRRRGVSRLCCADASALPFRDEAFDAVVALDLLEHIPDDQSAAEEMCRVLRPGGCLFVTVPAYRFLWSGHDLALMHQRRYTARELRSLLTSANLRVMRLSYAVTVLFPVVWIVRLRERRLREPRSSVQPLPVLLNKLLLGTLTLENAWLQFGSFPFGVSVVAVARRPDQP